MSSSQNTLTLSNGRPSAKVDLIQSKKAALILRALNHKLRQQMLKLLDENKKMTVTELYVKLRLEQSVASQHLAILRRAELVNTQRNGKFIFYAPNYARINEVMKFVTELVG
ncbi:MAG: metalloregulator ArsR/SmtB family transcription factor [Hydrotalea flava]|uniref:ArsR/SmtB family transcription factor n=1 Tax=Hydrotalea TaxID=1004300 RepID=UPI00082EF54C|nr:MULTISPECIES: metalloregulator ArsR/SmtB family transcription factor [Hydrotalea]RTL49887.1 MAG: transcriptional regulator [Sphingobacteriales bacterium]MBY0349121.1 metalloregulator ArsR/SmtB family transcription factor [Hydrotalea flava]NIM35719.1 metalloregulator ArsR/SmtB family transcription factor [Hydrotalea flava]NIM38578.1 metalloregulator ArsR/SmtB family transcription factor [Hydrotalea flava]NIN03755.1 metalloregulator ArsR/SmtB family transcription factor [Hydrotalea flava]